MSAIRGGSVEALALMLNSGSNPFSKNGLGESAVDIARNVNTRNN